jgi:cytochrome P450
VARYVINFTGGPVTIIDRTLVNFDHHAPVYLEEWMEMAAAFHATGNPIGWSKSHDGFWVVGSWAGVNSVGEDWETFTSYNDLEGTGNGGRGQLIPPNAYRLDLGESDPPLHTERRRLEVPFFTPRALRRWRPVARSYVIEALNAVVDAGECDLVKDVIIPVTAQTTLYVTGYGPEAWSDVAAVAHGSLLAPDHSDFPLEEITRLRGNFRDKLSQRKQEPTDDLISALATGSVQGAGLTLDEGESMMNALVFGGFDTAAATTVSALRVLDKHPEYRERIVDDEPFRKNFVEEVLRVYPPPAGMARTAVRDVELMGQHISAGESVFMWLAAANRDPSVFADPDTFDPERANAKDHVSFSTGHHRCLGSPLAKAEIADMLQIICREIDDLRIDEDSIQQTSAHGGVNGFTHMRATFTPRAPITQEASV